MLSELRPGLVAILPVQAALGLYLASLNALFYARFGPFFDSASYYAQLVDLHVTARDRGLLAALAQSVSHGTNVYPWLLGLPFAAWFEPHRAIGVWVHGVASTCMNAVLYLYFVRGRGMSRWLGLVLSTAFSFIGATFFYNGGGADFRMDLLQYFLYAAAMGSYLVAQGSDRHAAWCFFGFTVGLLCLGRATSPVYVVLLVLVLVPFDLAAARGRWRRALLLWSGAMGVALAVAGWFYTVRFDHLYYYYAVWNPDANANLPLAVSWRHLRFAARHLGPPLVLAALVCAAATLTVGLWRDGRGALARLNWRPLWFSAAPLGYLVLSGSGLNPFVSIAGVAGVLLFLFDPLEGERPRMPRGVDAVAAGLVAAGMFANAAGGIPNHAHETIVAGWVPRQAGLSEIRRVLASELRDGAPGVYAYSMVHVGSLNGVVLFNSLVYDGGLRPLAGRRVDVGNAVLGELRLPGFDSTERGWRRVPGDSDHARVQWIVGRIEADADLFLMAVEGSHLPRHVYGNRFVQEINRHLLASGAWVPVAEAIPVSPWEGITVLRKRALDARRAAGSS